MTRQHLPQALAGVLAALACTGALASTSAGAYLSGLKVTLYDLAPDDGIAPSISFAFTGNDSIHLDGDSDSLSRSTRIESNSPTLFSSRSIELPTTPHFAGGASESGDLPSANRALRAWTSTSNGLNPGQDVLVQSQAAEYFSFTLSPSTLMVLSGTANLSAYATRQVLASGASVSASASLSVFVLSEKGDVNNTVQAEADAGFDGDHVFAPDAEETRALSATYANTGASWMSGQIGDTVRTIGIENNDGAWGFGDGLGHGVSPVPEPASPSLLLAGLAALGALASRRTATRARRCAEGDLPRRA